MKRTVYFFLFVFFLVSVPVSAQMQLKLSEDIVSLPDATFGNSNLQSNLKLKLPETMMQPSLMELRRGMLMLAIMLDATFPIGDDFSNFAGTGFSGHLLLGYLLTENLMLTLTGGYIKFGDKDFGDGVTFKQTWSHSQIPILLGLNYILSMQSAFRFYLGFAAGLYLLQNSYTNEYTLFNETQTEESDETNTKFGIAPRLGALIAASAAILINLQIMYSYIFNKSESEGSKNLSHFAVMAGLMFALSK